MAPLGKLGEHGAGGTGHAVSGKVSHLPGDLYSLIAVQ